jgi:hypothetical protein
VSPPPSRLRSESLPGPRMSRCAEWLRSPMRRLAGVCGWVPTPPFLRAPLFLGDTPSRRRRNFRLEPPSFPAAGCSPPSRHRRMFPFTAMGWGIRCRPMSGPESPPIVENPSRGGNDDSSKVVGRSAYPRARCREKDRLIRSSTMRFPQPAARVGSVARRRCVDEKPRSGLRPPRAWAQAASDTDPSTAGG